MPQIQYTFQRVEKKFLLTPQQYDALLPALLERMEEDAFGLHTICNIYYDTPNYDLIRTSVEKPTYKEKFRLRSYGVPTENGHVFAEIKKKCNGVVYKRRVTDTPEAIDRFMHGQLLPQADPQIQREIRWMLHTYDPAPRTFIAYDRRAFAGKDDPDLRVTFDWNIRWRDTDLDLRAGDWGAPVRDDDRIVMEAKLANAAPLWLAHLLSQNDIYPASFSKYGACYLRHIVPRLTQKGTYAHVQ